MTLLPKRLGSIDTFRAITMLLMIFVNDVSGVKNIPAWIEHVAASEDGMGFADTVFPAFLFIVGLSLPFAIQHKMQKGATNVQVVTYIVSRSISLIVMGFFHVNMENYNYEALLPLPVWEICVTLAFFLIWLDYPAGLSRSIKYPLILTGILLLITMALLYKGGTPGKPEQMKPHWWGILGIIGWAYFVCSLVFLFTKGKLWLLLAVTGIFALVNICVHIGVLAINLPLLGDASSALLVMPGVVISILYGKLVEEGRARHITFLFTGIGVALIGAGLLIRPYAGGISKIHSTPAWVFICTGTSLLVFQLMVWLVDKRGHQNWFSLIKPAGTSTLTCYLLPYLLYAIYALTNFRYPAFMNEGIGGLIRSFLIAFLIIQVVGVMEKRRLHLKI